MGPCILDNNYVQFYIIQILIPMCDTNTNDDDILPSFSVNQPMGFHINTAQGVRVKRILRLELYSKRNGLKDYAPLVL